MNNELACIDNHDIIVIGMFLETKARRSEETAKIYRGVINGFFKFLDYKTMPTITYSDMIEYSKYLASPDPDRAPIVLAVSTQNTKIATIKSLFKYAMRIGYIHMNPAEPLETQRFDKKTAQRLLTESEVEDILIAAMKKGLTHLVVVYFFACTGCRESELANLMWKDFFTSPSGEICVSITGKGHKTRVLKVPTSLWKLILEYRKSNEFPYEIDSQAKSPFLINPHGNNYSRQTIWQMVKDVVEASKINKNASPHWIRHAFATSVAKDEYANLWRLQYDLGHASITTTQDYVHIARGMKNTSVDHLGYLNKIEQYLRDKGSLS